MFEGGNLLNMNLTPVTNIPLKPRFATSQVVWLSHRAIFANISQIFYFIFEGTVSICIFLLQLGSVCATCMCNINITCTTCAKQTWPFLLEICYSKKKTLFLHDPSIIITWVMQFISFIIFKHVV